MCTSSMRRGLLAPFWGSRTGVRRHAIRAGDRGEVLGEEALELVERNEISTVVEVDVPCPGDYDELLGFGSLLVHGVGEVARMRILSRDEQDRPRGDVLQVRKRSKLMWDSMLVTVNPPMERGWWPRSVT